MKCEQCNGTGEIYGWVHMRLKNVMQCDLCGGSGNVDSNTELKIVQGSKLKQIRLEIFQVG